MSFTVNCLPAGYGDSLWIEYGDDQQKYNILIDGGIGSTKYEILKIIEDLDEKNKVIELLVITHVDRDHIEGILNIFERETLPVIIKSVWFNGYHHLDSGGDEDFGPLQGERLSKAIKKHGCSWNSEFEQLAVVVPDSSILPVIELEGGMKLTLLSPTVEKLRLLKPVWESAVKAAGIFPGYGIGIEEDEAKLAQEEEDEESFGYGIPNVDQLAALDFEEDTKVANGSSIAFIADYEQKSVLFCADAHPSVLLDSLNKSGRDNLFFDLVKISHHGSRKNTGQRFLNSINSGKFLVSTNGAYYKHPSLETVAQIIKIQQGGKSLHFNYRTTFNSMWDNPILKGKYNYKTFYGDEHGIVVTV